MPNIHDKRLRPLFLGLSAVALLLLSIGIGDMSNTPYLGYQVSPDYTVVKVDANSPAAEAGLRPGDQIVTVGSVSTERLFELSRQPRTKIGEELKLAVIRDLNWREVAVRAAALPRKEWALAWSGNLVALLMLAMGLAIFWKYPRKPATLFFLSNYCLALAFMTPPYLESFVMRKVVALNFLLFLALGLAFFLHLSVVFPKAKPPVGETAVETLIYLPVPLMAVFFVSLMLFQPWADLRLNQFLHYAFGIAVLYCLGLALAAIVHSYWTRSAADAPASLGILLIGTFAGVVPPALGVLFDSFFPGILLPGREYYPLAVALASLAFAWALSRPSSQPESKALRSAA